MRRIFTLAAGSIKCALPLLVLLFFVSVKLQAQNNVLIPFSGSTLVPCGTNCNLQAHNGSSGTYSNNADGYAVLDAGFMAQIGIAGGYTTEASFDYIRIYNGVGTGGALLASYNGQNLTMSYVGTPGQTLTVRFQSDGSVVYAGFNLAVTYSGNCYSTPCSGTPQTNTIFANPTSICPGTTSTLSLAYGYTVGGLQYQWYSSTSSNVGPFTPVSNATNNALYTPTLGVTTWFQAVVTCTNSSSSMSTTGQQIMVQGTTTNTAPYYEGFEGVTVSNQLPNCSWLASNVPGSTNTYTSSNSNNRIPRSGNNFAGFYNSPTGTKYFYTNGIQLQPGITYSAGLWFATEYFGYNNWTLSVMVGTAQTAASQTQVAAASPAVSGPYKALGGTFTVPSPGLYYVAVRAVASSGSALYLSWDDLSVTIPCTPSSGNSPTVVVSSGNGTICSGDQVNLIATGANTYLWSNGATTNTVVLTPPYTSTIWVTGTNTLTGCAATNTVGITVNPSPTVFIVSGATTICPGQSVPLTAFGADNYAWSTGAQGNAITVSPTVATNYTVIGSALNGCAGTGTTSIFVKPQPTVTAISLSNPDLCAGETASLQASGAATYYWLNGNSGQIYQGNPLTVPLNAPTTFTVEGTGTNGCTAKYTITQNVLGCVGLREFAGSENRFRIFPNPSNGMLNITVSSGIIGQVDIMDLSGRVIYHENSVSSEMKLNITELKNGVYFIRISGDEGSEVMKLIRE